MNTFKKTIKGTDYEVSNDLKDFALFDRNSTHVAFIGINIPEGRLFVQFKNGHCIILKNVPATVQQAAQAAVSIGKFWHSDLKGKYEADTEISVPMVNLAPEDDHEEGAILDEEEDNTFGDFNGNNW